MFGIVHNIRSIDFITADSVITKVVLKRLEKGGRQTDAMFELFPAQVAKVGKELTKALQREKGIEVEGTDDEEEEEDMGKEGKKYLKFNPFITEAYFACDERVKNAWLYYVIFVCFLLHYFLK